MLDRWLRLFSCALLVAPTAIADQTDDFINSQLRRQRIPGLSLVVVRDGKVIKSSGYGVRDRSSGTPATPETVYRIGSVGKNFIASAVMLLAQENRIQLGDSVARYIEDAPDSWREISIRHLLNHSSGLPRDAPAWNAFTPQDDMAVIRSAYDVPLRFRPGEKWEYSNTGYFVLAEIISRVARQPWMAFLAERLFGPAGMSSTNVYTTVGAPNLSLSYRDNDKLELARNWTAVNPAGAYLSTVVDLAKWEALLASNQVLTEQTQLEMARPVTLRNGSSHPYGLGWELGEFRGHKRVHHTGSIEGFRSDFSRYVDDRLTIAVLLNLDDVALDTILDGLAAIYLAE